MRTHCKARCQTGPNVSLIWWRRWKRTVRLNSGQLSHPTPGTNNPYRYSTILMFVVMYVGRWGFVHNTQWTCGTVTSAAGTGWGGKV